MHNIHLGSNTCRGLVLYHTDGLQCKCGIAPCLHSVYYACTATVVVIGGSTPEVGQHAMAIGQHRLAINVDIIYHTRATVDGDSHALGSHFVACQHAVHLDSTCEYSL